MIMDIKGTLSLRAGVKAGWVDVFYELSPERYGEVAEHAVTEGLANRSTVHSRRPVRLLSASANEEILMMYPLITLPGDHFLKPKYAGIGTIVLEGFGLGCPEEDDDVAEMPQQCQYRKTLLPTSRLYAVVRTGLPCPNPGGPPKIRQRRLADPFLLKTCIGGYLGPAHTLPFMPRRQIDSGWGCANGRSMTAANYLQIGDARRRSIAVTSPDPSSSMEDGSGTGVLLVPETITT